MVSIQSANRLPQLNNSHGTQPVSQAVSSTANMTFDGFTKALEKESLSWDQRDISLTESYKILCDHNFPPDKAINGLDQWLNDVLQTARGYSPKQLNEKAHLLVNLEDKVGLPNAFALLARGYQLAHHLKDIGTPLQKTHSENASKLFNQLLENLLSKHPKACTGIELDKLFFDRHQVPQAFKTQLDKLSDKRLKTISSIASLALIPSLVAMGYLLFRPSLPGQSLTDPTGLGLSHANCSLPLAPTFDPAHLVFPTDTAAPTETDQNGFVLNNPTDISNNPAVDPALFVSPNNIAPPTDTQEKESTGSKFPKPEKVLNLMSRWDVAMRNPKKQLPAVILIPPVTESLSNHSETSPLNDSEPELATESLGLPSIPNNLPTFPIGEDQPEGTDESCESPNSNLSTSEASSVTSDDERSIPSSGSESKPLFDTSSEPSDSSSTTDKITSIGSSLAENAPSIAIGGSILVGIGAAYKILQRGCTWLCKSSKNELSGSALAGEKSFIPPKDSRGISSDPGSPNIDTTRAESDSDEKEDAVPPPIVSSFNRSSGSFYLADIPQPAPSSPFGDDPKPVDEGTTAVTLPVPASADLPPSVNVPGSESASISSIATVIDSTASPRSSDGTSSSSSSTPAPALLTPTAAAPESAISGDAAVLLPSVTAGTTTSDSSASAAPTEAAEDSAPAAQVPTTPPRASSIAGSPASPSTPLETLPPEQNSNPPNSIVSPETPIPSATAPSAVRTVPRLSPQGSDRSLVSARKRVAEKLKIGGTLPLNLSALTPGSFARPTFSEHKSDLPPRVLNFETSPAPAPTALSSMFSPPPLVPLANALSALTTPPSVALTAWGSPGSPGMVTFVDASARKPRTDARRGEESKGSEQVSQTLNAVSVKFSNLLQDLSKDRVVQALVKLVEGPFSYIKAPSASNPIWKLKDNDLLKMIASLDPSSISENQVKTMFTYIEEATECLTKGIDQSHPQFVRQINDLMLFAINIVYSLGLLKNIYLDPAFSATKDDAKAMDSKTNQNLPGRKKLIEVHKALDELLRVRFSSYESQLRYCHLIPPASTALNALRSTKALGIGAYCQQNNPGVATAAAQDEVMLGRDMIKLILNNEPTITVNDSPQARDRAIAAIIWFMMNMAITNHQGFIEGAFLLEDKDELLFNFLKSMPNCYEKASPHLVERNADKKFASDFTYPLALNYGIDVFHAILPSQKRAIEFVQLSLGKKKLLCIRLANFNMGQNETNESQWLLNDHEMLLVFKQKTHQSTSAAVDQAETVVPENIKACFFDIIKMMDPKTSEKQKQIADAPNLVRKYGVSYIDHFIKVHFKNAISEEIKPLIDKYNALIEALNKEGYKNLNLRIGREFIITDAELKATISNEDEDAAAAEAAD